MKLEYDYTSVFWHFQIYQDTSKNMIILIIWTLYISIDAPWSSESRALFPLWEELAEHFSEKDDVVVAKIDITANDVNLHLGEKYPSIKLFPAVYSERVSSLLRLTVLTCLRFKIYPYLG